MLFQKGCVPFTLLNESGFTGSFNHQLLFMHKETKGYFLLVILVITGLAGRMSFNTITNHERHALIHQLKDSKANFLSSINGLSEKQLNFKPAADKNSIRDVIRLQAVEESVLWNLTDASLKETTPADKHVANKIKDEELLQSESGFEPKAIVYSLLPPVKIPWTNTYETIEAFEQKRSFIITYVRTTTDDMRSHMVRNEKGALDAYQVLLLLSADTKNNTRRIEEIKAGSSFPKQ